MPLQVSPSDKKLHVAIIMDGNGRWARARGLPRTMGHKAGIEALRRTLEAARDFPISHLTLYSFSSENWGRPVEEVHDLMGLLRYYLKHELATLHKNNVRLRIIGDRTRLDADIADMIVAAEAKTAGNTAITLTLALSYGGQQEITDAVRSIVAKVANGDLAVDAISTETIGAHLYTHDMPNPDLVIRTSGEQRLSNFLIWQAAYAEFVFQDVLWPDYGREHLEAALVEFRARERRFGK
ncbi:MAG: isoprenyl transferase [Alphaproteobacteria bacterium]|nr:isoprenyl transferase [Alphaproteobacteria bacterium]